MLNLYVVRTSFYLSMSSLARGLLFYENISTLRSAYGKNCPSVCL